MYTDLWRQRRRSCTRRHLRSGRKRGSPTPTPVNQSVNRVVRKQLGRCGKLRGIRNDSHVMSRTRDSNECVRGDSQMRRSSHFTSNEQATLTSFGKVSLFVCVFSCVFFVLFQRKGKVTAAKNNPTLQTASRLCGEQRLKRQPRCVCRGSFT